MWLVIGPTTLRVWAFDEEESPSQPHNHALATEHSLALSHKGLLVWRCLATRRHIGHTRDCGAA